MEPAEAQIVPRAREFLALMQQGPAPTLEQLQLALDRIALAYAEAPAGAYDGDAPQVSPPPSREFIARRFPDLGLYRSADPDLDEPNDPLVGDGIDDLLDISTQMHELVELYDRSYRDAALHSLHQLAFHWLAHLRSLGVYLHFLRYIAPLRHD